MVKTLHCLKLDNIIVQQWLTGNYILGGKAKLHEYPFDIKFYCYHSIVTDGVHTDN